MDSILQQAHLINSDIGRHSVKCNFSTRLSGRFYQNSSLERNTARKSKLLDMQARKRRLERELRLEEQRVKLLEARLHETERSLADARDLIFTIGKGVVAFQSCVRRNQAVNRYVNMRHKARMKEFIALVLQSHFRGWKGRILVQSIREEIHKILRNKSAVVIQTLMRQKIQRMQYIALLSRNRMMKNRSASTIQAMLRGNLARRMYHDEMSRRECAAINVQRAFRGKLGRAEYNRLRELWIERHKKPKRVPLRMQRYSTYGIKSPRKMPKKIVGTRRRSSVEDMNHLMKMKMRNEQDENDSVASTLTSLTHATDNNCSRPSVVRSTKTISDSTNKANKISCHSTRRVLTSVSKQNAKVKSLAGNGDASGANPSRKSNGTSRKTEQYPYDTRTQRSVNGHKSANEKLNVRAPTLVKSNFSKTKSQDRKKKVPTCENERQNQQDEMIPDANKKGTIHSNIEIEPEPRHSVSTPSNISREAALIVEEILSRTIIMHGITSSTFEEEFSEHEDDLE